MQITANQTALQTAIANAETALRASALRMKETYEVVSKLAVANKYNDTDLDGFLQQIAAQALLSEQAADALRDAIL